MNKLVFPLLNADDIEVRIGNFNQEKTKCTLLLYKTARTDAKYLDEIVGVFNWQKKFYELKGVIYCSLGINVNYDKADEEPRFIWKDDAGAETQVESEKGQASDSFKRAGFAWGLGRELYSAPTIWVDNPKNYTDFQVDLITYDKDKRKIKDLVISAKDKNNNYQRVQLYPKGKDTPKSTENQPKNKGYFEPKDIKVGDTFLNNEKGSITDEQIKMIDTYVSGLTIVSHDNFFKRLDAVYGVGTINLLSEQQAQEIIDKIGGKK